MTIKLKIYLMGLVALIPTAKDHGLFALLQRTPQSHFHLPVLIWDATAVDAKVTENGIQIGHQGTEIKEQLKVKGATYNPAGLILDGERIALCETKKGIVKLHDHPRRPWYAPFVGAFPDNIEALVSTAWIPEMRSISRQAGRIRADLIRSPSPDKVAALLPLSAAASLSTFQVAHVHTKSDNRSDLGSFIFKSPGSNPLFGNRGAIADVAVLTVEIEAPQATLILRHFGRGAKAASVRQIVLTPRAEADSVDLLIGNLSPATGRAEELQGDHFALYYDLTEHGGSVDKRVPVVEKTKRPSFNPLLPEVISSVSGSCGNDGGVCRPICGLAIFREPVQ
jgi:hypothetical protein